MRMVRDLLLGVWLVGAAWAFWGAYLPGAGAADLTALYGVMLLASVTALLLRFLSGRGPAGRQEGPVE